MPFSEPLTIDVCLPLYLLLLLVVPGAFTILAVIIGYIRAVVSRYQSLQPVDPKSVEYSMALFGAIIERRGDVPSECWENAFTAFRVIVTFVKQHQAGDNGQGVNGGGNEG